ncbi:MAG: 16S rRNA (cytidine(1402)-2'-O)-methyltransferase, partial [Lachnospiraceae bacterium]|nr:16S rRNA (cytidine(1402)-2'-O)-methyltransferase [Lachnospiraceae bacterium]
MVGTLYLVGTPIGNLEDMTWRAVRTLQEADLIACEDTRTSAPLLRHFEVHTPVTSYHKFNEAEKSEELVGKLLGGTNVALITDAGMPGISDPGELLVRKCMEVSIPVTAVPGASACVTALAISGADTRRFVFEGFLPQENKEKREALARLADETRTVIFYEAPHRLAKTLDTLRGALGDDRKISLCRELTKKFETVERMTLGEAADLYGGGGENAKKPRGEYVLVVDGKSREKIAEENTKMWETMDVAAHVAMYEGRGMS